MMPMGRMQAQREPMPSKTVHVKKRRERDAGWSVTSGASASYGKIVAVEHREKVM